MSELANRMDLESEFASRLSRLTSRQRRELREKLGAPPDPLRITQQDWDRWQREREAMLLGLLLLVSLTSAEQHAKEVQAKLQRQRPDLDIEGASRRAARDWSVKAAREAAAEQLRNTRAEFERRAATWSELQRSGTEVPGDLVDEDLVGLMGPRWDANTAATYTTAGNSAGINGTRDAAAEAGVPMVLRWFTRADDRVCPICGPLHRKIVDTWELVLRNVPGGWQAASEIAANGGPPAHRNCRCWTELVPMKTPIGVLTP